MNYYSAVGRLGHFGAPTHFDRGEAKREGEHHSCGEAIYPAMYFSEGPSGSIPRPIAWRHCTIPKKIYAAITIDHFDFHWLARLGPAAFSGKGGKAMGVDRRRRTGGAGSGVRGDR